MGKNQTKPKQKKTDHGADGFSWLSLKLGLLSLSPASSILYTTFHSTL